MSETGSAWAASRWLGCPNPSTDPDFGAALTKALSGRWDTSVGAPSCSAKGSSCLLPVPALNAHLLVLPNPGRWRQVVPWQPWGVGGGGPGGQACRGPPSLLPVMFCGMGGFSDFYKLRWLEAILSWQKQREGCFGEPGELCCCPG